MEMNKSAGVNMPLFEIKDVDKRYYQEHLEGFLPEKMIDIHTHIYKKEITGTGIVHDKRLVSWTSLVAEDNPIDELMESYRLLFPGKKVTPCIFPWVEPVEKIDELNRYTQACAASHNLPALLLAHPHWPAEKLEQELTEGRYLGIKVYLSFAPPYIPGDEVRIFDFLLPHQLAVLDKLGLVVMLHIPRSGRLKDPVNLAQILEIEQKYPNLKLILAHVGRAYCREDVGNAFEILGKTERLVFDFCANTNAWVFARALESLGPERLLFGSDLPITRMRMRRICEGGTYINLIPRGLYGDVSGDKNMRELQGEDANALSFFLYEEIRAMKDAVEELGLGKSDVESLFYNNAKRIIESAGFSMEGAGASE
jgi:hypothetical protein